MTDDCPPTDPSAPVIVNVNRRTEDLPKRRRNGITLAAIGAVVGIILAGVGFFASYVFVTKPELAAHAHPKSDAIHEIETQQALTDAAVKQLTKEIEEVKVEQRLTNKNLNKLLRRSRITPASRADIIIEMEEDNEP